MTKGGLSCVFGGCGGLHALGIATTDYLLNLFLSNDKYSCVLVLALDWCIPEIFRHCAKLTVLATLEELTGILKESTDTTHTAVVVYSGSAIFLSQESAPDGLQAVSTLVTGLHGLPAVVVLFHTSVHTSSERNKLKCLFANIIDVSPTQNAISSDVLATCRSIRTARSSAKRATEDEEFLVRRELSRYGGAPHDEQHMPSLTILAPVVSRGVSSKPEATSVAAARKIEMEQQEDSSPTCIDTIPAAPAAPLTSSAQPLVIFDKGDPEWDEDSDPDDDLDL